MLIYEAICHFDYSLEMSGPDVFGSCTVRHTCSTQPGIVRVGSFHTSRKYSVRFGRRLGRTCRGNDTHSLTVDYIFSHFIADGVVSLQVTRNAGGFCSISNINFDY